MVTTETDYGLLLDVLIAFLGDYNNHNPTTGQVSFNCPTCSYDIKHLDKLDEKYNLEVNYKKNVFKCWSCCDTHNTHGSIFTLIKKYGNYKLLKKYFLLKPQFENSEYTKKYYKKIYLPKEFIPFHNIPSAFKLIPQYKQAHYYLKSRNITDDIIKKFNIGFCYQGEYANRIIIPSYDINDELNYFIARSYLSKQKLKYKNPEAQKELIIFNERFINWDEDVYIVEGVFDSIFLPNSIPLLGKHMHKHLFDMLYDNAKNIIIVLDGDAWDDGVKLYHNINCGKLMNKVWIVKLPVDKDIADLQGNILNFKPKKID